MSRGFRKLGDLVKISKGKKANNVTREFEAGLKRFIQIDDLRNDNNLKYTSDDGVVVKENDIIIAWDGANAGTIGYGLNGIIGSTLAALTLKTDQIDSKYLGRFLQTKSEYLRSKCTGATIPHISKDVLLNLSVPIVPIEDQHRIVKILDLAQSLIEKRKQAIAYLDDYIKAVFLDMFGDPVTNPKGWEVKTLKELTIKIGSGATPKGGKAAYLTRGISLIRSLNIHDNSFHYKDLAFINHQQAKELSSVVVKQNDVLLNITGASVARCVIVPDSVLPARVNQHVAILRPTDEIKSTFLLHLLISENYKRKLLLHAAEGGATREALTKQQLEKFEIICPAIEAQIKFCEIVEKIENIKQKTQTQLKELENNFQAQLQRAFSGE